jgi:hypothetical protein
VSIDDITPDSFWVEAGKAPYLDTIVQVSCVGAIQNRPGTYVFFTWTDLATGGSWYREAARFLADYRPLRVELADGEAA